MAKAIFFGATEAQFLEAQDTRSFRLTTAFLANVVGVSRFEDLAEIGFLLFCSNSKPKWLLAVQDFLLVPGQSGEVLARLSEIKNVSEVLRGPGSSYSGCGVFLNLPDAFFSEFEQVEFSVNLDLLSSLSLSKATKMLADTYGVDAAQVKITISN